VQGLDLNQRPSGYEPDELPGCSTLQRMGGRETLTLVALSTDFSCPGKMREFGMIVRLTAALLKP
jgi:hypothetical protein